MSDVADIRDNKTVEGVEVIMVWSSNTTLVDASWRRCTGSSRFTNEGRVPPKSVPSYEVFDNVLSNEDVYLVVKPKVLTTSKDLRLIEKILWIVRFLAIDV